MSKSFGPELKCIISSRLCTGISPQLNYHLYTPIDLRESQIHGLHLKDGCLQSRSSISPALFPANS